MRMGGGAAGMHAVHPGPGSRFMTQERFDELDWDGDGFITFKEFLFAFESWVGFDDDAEGEAEFK